MIILEFDEWKSDSYTRDYAHRMLRKSGSKMSLNGPDAEDLIYQINTAKSLGISEKELLRILAASNHPDDLGKILFDLKGLTRRYADMYHTDRSIPLNKRKRVNEEQKEDIDLYNKYYNASIPSRFDKWISTSFGSIPGHLHDIIDFTDEEWNFAGRQPDGTYAFVRTYPKPQQVMFTKRFNDVAQYVSLPGRKY